VWWTKYEYMQRTSVQEIFGSGHSSCFVLLNVGTNSVFVVWRRNRNTKETWKWLLKHLSLEFVMLEKCRRVRRSGERITGRKARNMTICAEEQVNAICMFHVFSNK
jgi:hypothetical protein